jgi:hypothetical protein
MDRGGGGRNKLSTTADMNITQNYLLCKLTKIGYGLDRGSILGREGIFSLRCRIPTCSKTHPASYSVDTEASFVGGKAAGAQS